MALISASELTTLRETQAATFDLTSTITRPGTYTSDGEGGGAAATPITVADGVPCRLSVLRTQAAETVVAGLIQGQTVFVYRAAVGTDVQMKDQIAIVETEKSYEVIALWGPRSIQTSVVALCVER